MVKVFFDASVIFSAVYSQNGASYALTCFVKEQRIVGITTQTVIEEVVRNSEKIQDVTPAILHNFIAEHNFIVREHVTTGEIKPFLRIVHQKDAHILAGAANTQCDYLVTLDKKHINKPSVKKLITDFKIVSPQKLLKILVE